MKPEQTIPPHGGYLHVRLHAEKAQALREEAKSLPQLALDERKLADLEMLAIGAMSPLEGFMGREDYESVVKGMRLHNGVAWSMPITLTVDRALAAKAESAGRLGLTDGQGNLLAIMTVKDQYGYDKKNEARMVFRTEDPDHPGVAALYTQEEVGIGGPVEVLALPGGLPFLDHRLTPSQTREYFINMGWRRVVGFQTRNPVHRAHEYIQKVAMEIVDGLLLHPLVGSTKSDDIPADVRMKCYEVLLENYYPKNRVLLSVFPAAMRYGGPREAIFHALVRKNYGCTHFIVGRDHAGVGNYYGSYDAQHIFDEFRPEELGITPLFFENSFFCKKSGVMATEKTSPGGPEDRISLSGTKVREMLRAGQLPPPEFTRPEVAQVLIDHMRQTEG